MLHTRVTIAAFNLGDMFYRYREEFGVDYTPDHSQVEQLPEVKAKCERLQKTYGYERVRVVDTRDTY